MILKKPWWILCWLLLVASASAEELREDPAEERVREIAKDLRCAVCQNQSVYESNSDLAKSMLGIIRDQVKAGKDDAEIRDYFLARYGDYITLEPRKSGANWLIWLGPFLALVLGGVALHVAIRRWSVKSRTPPAGEATPEERALREKLARELDDIRL